ncbi:MAG: PQQ-binding-like beta-propeller repeat protein [Acidobacteriota bacterium]|jgi:outer membrane protein assembly factor BamB
MRKRVFLSTWLFLFASCVFAQNWPSLRGPEAKGLADGLNPPIEWDIDQPLNILWRTPIPGLSHSSPIIWEDRIFVATVISSDPNPDFRRAFALMGAEAATSSKDMYRQSWRLYCLDKKSGEIRWEKIVHEGIPKNKRHPKNSHASQTPATNGKYVIVYFGSEGLYCFDMEGNLQWSRDLGVMVHPMGWGVASSPIIYKNLAIVQADHNEGSFIAAFDLETGKKVWSTPRDVITSWSTPTVYEGRTRTELVTNGTDLLIGYDPTTGKKLWSLKGTSRQSIPTPFEANGLLYFFSGFHSEGPMFAIRPGGSGDITPAEGENSGPYVAWRKERGAPEIPTPIVYGDYLYVVSNNGILSCYQAKTGERVYQERMGGVGGAFTASLIAADGRIYLTSEDGEIYVIKAGPTYELLALNSMGEVCLATPAVSSGMLVIRTQHHLFGIGEK